MQYSVRTILGFAVQASDGLCSSVHDVLFDDDSWKICYLVMRTKSAENYRDFQLTIDSIHSLDVSNHIVKYGQTCSTAQLTEHIDIDPPVSRQQQIKRRAIRALASFYEFDFTWGTFPTFPLGIHLSQNSSGFASRSSNCEEQKYNPHLRSSREVTGYRVHSPDGKAGRVVDILFDDTNQAVRYFVVESRRFWHRTRVLLPVMLIHGVCWSMMRVSTKLDRKAVRSLPKDESEDFALTAAIAKSVHGAESSL